MYTSTNNAGMEFMQVRLHVAPLGMLTYTHRTHTCRGAEELQKWLDNWGQVVGQTEHQQKLCLQDFWQEVQARASWGGWDVLHVRRLHACITQGREAVLSGCRGACKLERQGRREMKWWLMAEGNSSHISGQHGRSPAACWLSAVLFLKLFKRSHDCTRDTLRLRCIFCDWLRVVLKESPKVTAQTTRRCIGVTLCFTKKEDTALDNNLMTWKWLRRYRSEDIFHGSEEVPFQMH